LSPITDFKSQVLARPGREVTIKPKNRFWITESSDDVPQDGQIFDDFNSVLTNGAYVDFNSAPEWVNTAIVVRNDAVTYSVIYEASPASALDAIEKDSLASYVARKTGGVPDPKIILLVEQKM
jgi:hypothetical protein